MNKNNKNQDEIIQIVSQVQYLQIRISEILDIDASIYYKSMTFNCSENLLVYRTIEKQLDSFGGSHEKQIKLVPNIQIMNKKITDENTINFHLDFNKCLDFKFSLINWMSVLVDANKQLVIFTDETPKKGPNMKKIMENVKFYEWNPCHLEYLLIITDKKMVSFNINKDEEYVLNFHLPDLLSSKKKDNEYVVKAHWSFDGNHIIAKSNRNDVIVFNKYMSFISSFFDDWSEEFIILKNENYDSDNQLFIFSCGNNREIGEFEIVCYNLAKDKTPIKTKFESIDDFQNFNSQIFAFYDYHNDYIYLAMKYHNVIHCLNYNRYMHSIRLDQTVVIRNQFNIIHICLSPIEVLKRASNEIARYLYLNLNENFMGVGEIYTKKRGITHNYFFSTFGLTHF